MIKEHDYDELLEFVKGTLNQIVDNSQGISSQTDIQICSIPKELPFNPQNERQEHYFVHDIDEEETYEDLHDRILRYIEVFPGNEFEGWVIVRFCDANQAYVMEIEERPFNGHNMPNINFGFSELDMFKDDEREEFTKEVKRLKKVINKLTKSIELLNE